MTANLNPVLATFVDSCYDRVKAQRKAMLHIRLKAGGGIVGNTGKSFWIAKPYVCTIDLKEIDTFVGVGKFVSVIAVLIEHCLL